MARILVVEDDDISRYAVVRLLTGAGYAVSDASDYQAALSILEDGSPIDVLIVDVVLPIVHGFALARMARMRHRGIRCIYVTAFDLPTGEAIGPVLRKPINGEQLLAEVAAALP